ncbi:MAG: alkaline phosphatase family protein [Chitinophagaceae bacterium]|nr:alkaline phosphatase family protein [Chitinophagaceae bacterium]
MKIVKLLTIVMLIMCGAGRGAAQTVSRRTENLVVVTLDGMRWQEVFGGLDPALTDNKQYTRNKAGLNKKFYSPDIRERRKKLFPFLWTTVETKGQLYGNRNIGNLVNVANPYQFSYPGYNEIFTGYPDTLVNSNDKVLNKNTNVLEFINRQKGFTGKVAAFTTWDVFPYIFNTGRSGLYVNSGVDSLRFSDKGLQVVNEMQFLAPQPLEVRPDVITYFAGKEYLKTYQPRVLYIAFDETDDFAHAGLYDQYIDQAHAEDAMIADLWNTLQSMSAYKDKTTLIITCDHGRGDKVKDNWRHHGKEIAESGDIWMAVIGPDTPPAGEVSTHTQLYQKQWAPTMAALLGLQFRPDRGIAEPVLTILK